MIGGGGEVEWEHEAGDYTDPIEGEKCRWKDGKWNAEKKKKRKVE